MPIPEMENRDNIYLGKNVKRKQEFPRTEYMYFEIKWVKQMSYKIKTKTLKFFIMRNREERKQKKKITEQRKFKESRK